jgi:hypothetical protein
MMNINGALLGGKRSLKVSHYVLWFAVPAGLVVTVMLVLHPDLLVAGVVLALCLFIGGIGLYFLMDIKMKKQVEAEIVSCLEEVTGFVSVFFLYRQDDIPLLEIYSTLQSHLTHRTESLEIMRLFKQKLLKNEKRLKLKDSSYKMEVELAELGVPVQLLTILEDCATYADTVST